MSQPNTIYARKNDSEYIRPRNIPKGSKQTLSVDYNNFLDGDTIASSAWTTEESNVSLSGSANSGGIATVDVTGTDEGIALIKNTMTTTTSGEVQVRYFRVTVQDPRLPTIGDYGL